LPFLFTHGWGFSPVGLSRIAYLSISGFSGEGSWDSIHDVDSARVFLGAWVLGRLVRFLSERPEGSAHGHLNKKENRYIRPIQSFRPTPYFVEIL
jgi:hypothetical protein